jgi:hypothetical protein
VSTRGIHDGLYDPNVEGDMKMATGPRGKDLEDSAQVGKDRKDVDGEEDQNWQ